MSTAVSRRLPLGAYVLGAAAAVAVLAVGAGREWSFERELFWIRGTAWCALVALGVSISASAFGKVLVRLKRATKPSVNRMRRALGITAAALATLHAGLALTTYMRDSWMQTLDLAWVRSGVVALAILLVLWLTSYPAIVKRARVKAWKVLHRLAYVALALAIHHALLSPFAPRGWVLAFAAVVGAASLLRLARWKLER